MYQFKSIVEHKAYNYFAWVPKEISDQLHFKGVIPVKGTVNQCIFKGVLLPRKPNRHVLSLHSEIRNTAKLQVNNTIVADIEHDPEPRTIPIPDDVELIFKENQDIWDRFTAMTESQRNEIISYIISAKKADTRLSRIEKIAKRLHDYAYSGK